MGLLSRLFMLDGPRGFTPATEPQRAPATFVQAVTKYGDEWRVYMQRGFQKPDPHWDDAITTASREADAMLDCERNKAKPYGRAIRAYRTLWR